MPMAQGVCAHPIRTQDADCSNHKVALLMLRDMWRWLCQTPRVQPTRAAGGELSTSSQHGTSMIFGEFGLLQGLGTAVHVQITFPWQPGQPTCLLPLPRFQVEVNTGLIDRVGNKLLLLHTDVLQGDVSSLHRLERTMLGEGGQARHCFPTLLFSRLRTTFPNGVTFLMCSMKPLASVLDTACGLLLPSS